MPFISSSETGRALRAGAALASEAGGDDRANGAASATAASGGPPRSSVPDPAGARTLELLVSDFARALGCEVALVCELDGDSGAQVVCASGIDRPVAITISRRGGRRRSAAARTRGGCFVGRALTHEHPAFETLDPDRDANLLRAADTCRVGFWSGLGEGTSLPRVAGVEFGSHNVHGVRRNDLVASDSSPA